MTRPRKWRKVCSLPENTVYGPIDGQAKKNDLIMMEVEEYETLRLIDHEGLTQAECARRMKVARTTVQKIYNDARKKAAAILVQGCFLKIEGGNYKFYEEKEYVYDCKECKSGRCRVGFQKISK